MWSIGATVTTWTFVLIRCECLSAAPVTVGAHLEQLFCADGDRFFLIATLVLTMSYGSRRTSRTCFLALSHEVFSLGLGSGLTTRSRRRPETTSQTSTASLSNRVLASLHDALLPLHNRLVLAFYLVSWTACEDVCDQEGCCMLVVVMIMVLVVVVMMSP